MGTDDPALPIVKSILLLVDVSWHVTLIYKIFQMNAQVLLTRFPGINEVRVEEFFDVSTASTKIEVVPNIWLVLKVFCIQN